MKVTLKELGRTGVAGPALPTRIRSIDSKTLRPADTADLSRLVAAATASNPASPTGPLGGADITTNIIIIEDEHGVTELRRKDSELSEASPSARDFAMLLDWLHQHLP